MTNTELLDLLKTMGSLLEQNAKNFQSDFSEGVSFGFQQALDTISQHLEKEE